MKKILSIFLAAIMIIAACVPAFASIATAISDDEMKEWVGVDEFPSIYKHFSDVQPSDWYFDAVTYCSAGYMTGYSDGRFGPNDPIQRQDYAVIMERVQNLIGVAGSEIRIYDTVFSFLSKLKHYPDVPVNQYYTAAVNYAGLSGTMNGYNNGKFGVGDYLTREQAITVLCNSDGNASIYIDKLKTLYPDEEDIVAREREHLKELYKDADKISDFAVLAMSWAATYELFPADMENAEPQKNITRAQVAYILTKYDSAQGFHLAYELSKIEDNSVDIPTPAPSGHTVKTFNNTVTHKLDNKTLNPFNDISETDWFYDAVIDCYEANIVRGYGDGSFGPANTLKRQDFAVMIFRLFTDGVDEFPDSEAARIISFLQTSQYFNDVPSNQYYTAAVNMLAMVGIINGYENGNFGVNDTITREQAAAILMRLLLVFSNKPLPSYEDNKEEIDEILEPYTDKNKISDWAIVPMAWCIENGIFTGKNETTLAPQDFLTRAEAATVMYRIIN